MERLSETRKRVDADGEPQKSSKARTWNMAYLQQKIEIEKDSKLQQIEEQRQERAERQHVNICYKIFKVQCWSNKNNLMIY